MKKLQSLKALEPGRDPRIDQVVADRYRIVRKLGEGGMGAVYEGVHELINRRVAIKCLHAQFAASPDILARFHREALAVTAIGHENIIDVTDMGRMADDTVFMVLEYLDGRDWAHDIIDTGAQPLGKVVHITSQICDALTAAHEQGIVHRDLKPQNIYLLQRKDDPFFVKVLDFGISKVLDGSAEATGGGGLTATGTMLGTPHFMSPEQAQGKKDIDHRSDIYSLGVMIFQALTNNFPFDSTAIPALITMIVLDDPPPVRSFRPDLPEAVEQILNKMLEKEPGDRFADCAEVKAALRPFAQVFEHPTLITSSGVSGARTPSSGTGATPISASSKVPDALMPSSGTGSQAQAVGSDPGPVTHEPLAPARSSGSKLLVPAMILGLLLAVAAVAGVLWLANGPGDDVVAAPPPLVTPRPPEPPVKATPVVTAPPQVQQETPPARMVTVEIMTEPIDAELYLDGHRIPNPFDGELPSTEIPRRLVVKRAGYLTKEQALSLIFPQRVRIKLETTAGEGAGALEQPGPEKTSTGSNRPRPRPEEPRPPTPVKATPPVSPVRPPATKEPRVESPPTDLKRITIP